MEALKMEDRVDRWNDDRLDELSRRMDEGFKEMREGFDRMVTREEVKEIITTINARIEQVDRETKERFEQAGRETKEGFDKVGRETKEGFQQVDERFDRLYYTLITASFGLVVSVVLAVAFG
jgi:chromosome segregation ATPase